MSPVENELLSAVSRLDPHSMKVVFELVEVPAFGQTAPRLRDWCLDALVARAKSIDDEEPCSVELPDVNGWPDSDVAESLAGCLLLRRAVVLPMQHEFTILLNDWFALHAITRLRCRNVASNN